MDPQIHILRDLNAGQTTTDSLHGRQPLKLEVLTENLTRMQTEGLIASRPLGPLTVWYLTSAGRALL